MVPSVAVGASQVMLVVKNPPAKAGDIRDSGLVLGGEGPWEDTLEEEMATHCSILPGESHRQRSLTGCSPWGH